MSGVQNPDRKLIAGIHRGLSMAMFDYGRVYCLVVLGIHIVDDFLIPDYI